MTGFDYHLCGLHLHSSFQLPELVENEVPQGQPDITVRLGNLPDCLADSDVVRPMYQVKRPGTYFLNIDDIGRFQACEGREIMVDPDHEAGDPDIRAILFGSLFGVIFHQRAMLPLHASSVLTQEGAAVAFAGDSGMGKSSMAAWLSMQGYRLVSDDLLISDPVGADGLCVRPAFPRLKVWQDVLDEMGVSTDGLPLDSRYWQRFQWRRPDGFEIAPVPFKALYVLKWSQAGEGIDIRRLEGVERLDALRSHIFRYHQARQLGYEAQMFQAITALAGQLPVFVLKRPKVLGQLHTVQNRLEQHWSELG